VLKSLLARGAECPKVLAATHFHDVFHPDFLDPNLLPITFSHMEVMFTTGDGKLIMGREGSTAASGEVGRRIGRGENMTYLYRYEDQRHHHFWLTIV